MYIIWYVHDICTYTYAKFKTLTVFFGYPVDIGYLTPGPAYEWRTPDSPCSWGFTLFKEGDVWHKPGMGDDTHQMFSRVPAFDPAFVLPWYVEQTMALQDSWDITKPITLNKAIVIIPKFPDINGWCKPSKTWMVYDTAFTTLPFGNQTWLISWKIPYKWRFW